MGRSPGYATVAVLKALESGVRYGLDIVERTGLPSGTVYPILSRLERSGMVRGHWEPVAVARAEGRPRRRYYELRPAGRAELREAVQRFGAMLIVPPDDASPERA
jgi:DNA-binding PadR family transcriptional regulator